MRGKGEDRTESQAAGQRGRRGLRKGGHRKGKNGISPKEIFPNIDGNTSLAG